MSGTELTVVIPVLNEGARFQALWSNLNQHMPARSQVFVVYDFEEDDTLPIVKEIKAVGEKRLHLLKNSFGPGVVGAIKTGFDAVDTGPVVVVMGDLSDDLQQIGPMLELYDRGFHLVAGSRYMRGGSIRNGPWLKQGLSRLAGVSLFWLRGIPTHDSTNAFKLYDSKMLRSLKLESTKGFELSLEITVKAFLAGFKIIEIPASWEERTAGTSKFRLWKWLPGYLKWYFYAFQPKRTPKIATI